MNPNPFGGSNFRAPSRLLGANGKTAPRINHPLQSNPLMAVSAVKRSTQQQSSLLSATSRPIPTPNQNTTTLAPTNSTTCPSQTIPNQTQHVIVTTQQLQQEQQQCLTHDPQNHNNNSSVNHDPKPVTLSQPSPFPSDHMQSLPLPTSQISPSTYTLSSSPSLSETGTTTFSAIPLDYPATNNPPDISPPSQNHKKSGSDNIVDHQKNYNLAHLDKNLALSSDYNHNCCQNSPDSSKIGAQQLEFSQFYIDPHLNNTPYAHRYNNMLLETEQYLHQIRTQSYCPPDLTTKVSNSLHLHPGPAISSTFHREYDGDQYSSLLHNLAFQYLSSFQQPQTRQHLNCPLNSPYSHALGSFTNDHTPSLHAGTAAYGSPRLDSDHTSISSTSSLAQPLPQRGSFTTPQCSYSPRLSPKTPMIPATTDEQSLIFLNTPIFTCSSPKSTKLDGSKQTDVDSQKLQIDILPYHIFCFNFPMSLFFSSNDDNNEKKSSTHARLHNILSHLLLHNINGWSTYHDRLENHMKDVASQDIDAPLQKNNRFVHFVLKHDEVSFLLDFTSLQSLFSYISTQLHHYTVQYNHIMQKQPSNRGSLTLSTFSSLSLLNTMSFSHPRKSTTNLSDLDQQTITTYHIYSQLHAKMAPLLSPCITPQNHAESSPELSWIPLQISQGLSMSDFSVESALVSTISNLLSKHSIPILSLSTNDHEYVCVQSSQLYQALFIISHHYNTQSSTNSLFLLDDFSLKAPNPSPRMHTIHISPFNAVTICDARNSHKKFEFSDISLNQHLLGQIALLFPPPPVLALSQRVQNMNNASSRSRESLTLIPQLQVQQSSPSPVLSSTTTTSTTTTSTTISSTLTLQLLQPTIFLIPFSLHEVIHHASPRVLSIVEMLSMRIEQNYAENLTLTNYGNSQSKNRENVLFFTFTEINDEISILCDINVLHMMSYNNGEETFIINEQLYNYTKLPKEKDNNIRSGGINENLDLSWYTLDVLLPLLNNSQQNTIKDTTQSNQLPHFEGNSPQNRFVQQLWLLPDEKHNLTVPPMSKNTSIVSTSCIERCRDIYRHHIFSTITPLTIYTILVTVTTHFQENYALLKQQPNDETSATKNELFLSLLASTITSLVTNITENIQWYDVHGKNISQMSPQHSKQFHYCSQLLQQINNTLDEWGDHATISPIKSLDSMTPLTNPASPKTKREEIYHFFLTSFLFYLPPHIKLLLATLDDLYTMIWFILSVELNMTDPHADNKKHSTVLHSLSKLHSTPPPAPDSWLGRSWKVFELSGEWDTMAIGLVSALSQTVTENTKNDTSSTNQTYSLCPLYLSTFKTDYLCVPSYGVFTALFRLLNKGYNVISGILD